MQRRIPAWLLSLAFHLAILLAGALLVRGTIPPAERHEPPRPGAIVLAHMSSQSPPRYFSEEETTSKLAADGGMETVAAEMPAPASPPGSEFSLPSAAVAAADGQLLVVRPAVNASRGKGRFGGMSAEDVAAILAEDAARAKPAAPTGPTAKVSLFGSAEAEGRSFVFLIDRSQSMGHRGLGAIAEAAKELAASIDRLSPEQKFQVIAYNQKADSLGGRELLAATPENKRRLIEFVETTVAVGATEHELGLFAALRYKPDVIFLLTDAGDPGLGTGQLRAIREAAAGRTVIHCLHFGAGPLSGEANFMERLAADNGGSYVYIDMRTK
ncbi:MAG TPA: hypothetical protein VMP01_10125 [Pirellulaceae bacterium]|nr:hypothetical protein [Pirellulaceae bacterium]